MTIYGTEEQHRKMPGLYRDIRNMQSDVLNQTTDNSKDVPKTSQDNSKLIEKILRDRVGL